MEISAKFRSPFQKPPQPLLLDTRHWISARHVSTEGGGGVGSLAGNVFAAGAFHVAKQGNKPRNLFGTFPFFSLIIIHCFTANPPHTQVKLNSNEKSQIQSPNCMLLRFKLL